MNENESQSAYSNKAMEKEEDLRSSESEDSAVSLLWNETGQSANVKRSYTQSIPSLRTHLFISVFNIIIFVVSLIMMWISLQRSKVTLQDHWRATTFYSPIYDRFKIPIVNLVTNGTVFDTKPPSVWRQRIGSDADDAWNRVGNIVPPIAITAKDIRALGKDPRQSVRIPDDYGYGPDAYFASVETFHHIHCLDKLRREISYDHYWAKEEGPAPGSAMHEAHTNHCIDMLIQSLMCTASVDMVTYNWVEGRDMMLPDFNNNKVCRDFETVLEWVNENGVQFNETQIRAMKPPVDAIRVPNELHPPS